MTESSGGFGSRRSSGQIRSRAGKRRAPQTLNVFEKHPLQAQAETKPSVFQPTSKKPPPRRQELRFVFSFRFVLSFFWGPSVIFPVRADRHSQEESGTILIMSSHLLTFV